MKQLKYNNQDIVFLIKKKENNIKKNKIELKKLNKIYNEYCKNNIENFENSIEYKKMKRKLYILNLKNNNRLQL